MSKCMQHNTIKVPQGNAWQLLLPLKTAHWSGKDLVTETIDYRALEDVQVLIDGVVWEDWQPTEDGPLCDIPADMPLGPHNTVITATYFGVEVKASYFENFTIVAWSFESNVGEHLLDAPLVSEAAYIYVGITDDEELEELKQQLRESIAANETARLAYEAAQAELEQKAEAMDDVATETNATANKEAIIEAVNNAQPDLTAVAKEQTLTAGITAGAKEATLTAVRDAVLNAISGITIDTSDLAKQATLTAARDAIIAAINNIDLSAVAKESTLEAGIATIIAAIGNISVDGIDTLLAFFGLDGESRGYTAATAAEIITLNNELLAEAWPECPVSGPSYVDDEDTDTRYYADGTSVTPIPES